MCNCTFWNGHGTKEHYKNNQVLLEAPKNIELRSNTPEAELKTCVSIDRCLVDEVKILWGLGIITTGCCCGHNQQNGYIGVEEGFITHMKKLGYETAFNPCRPEDEDEFYPKSVERINDIYFHSRKNNR